jgi:hypothetical protein
LSGYVRLKFFATNQSVTKKVQQQLTMAGGSCMSKKEACASVKVKFQRTFTDEFPKHVLRGASPIECCAST